MRTVSTNNAVYAAVNCPITWGSYLHSAVKLFLGAAANDKLGHKGSRHSVIIGD